MSLLLTLIIEVSVYLKCFIQFNKKRSIDVQANYLFPSGLQITEQPAANAVEIFLAAKTIGKFHGINAATTPTG